MSNVRRARRMRKKLAQRMAKNGPHPHPFRKWKGDQEMKKSTKK